MSLFEYLGNTFNPNANRVKIMGSVLVMTVLNDAQELGYKGNSVESVIKINYAKYIILQMGGNLHQEVDPDEMYSNFTNNRIAEYKKELMG